MAERVRAGDLLRRARAVYDSSPALAGSAGAAWRTVFASGGRWMREALGQLRDAPLPEAPANLNALGLIKYGLASAAALVPVALAVLLGQPPWLLLCVPAFYAVEAQMVFLFPLALDGERRPFRESLRWTARAGGTLAVMRVVLPVAGTMLFGGLVGGGVVRSWCVGCLAICLWYEELRGRAGESSPGRPLFPFEVGAFGPLLLRREVPLGLPGPIRLLYASDLHLGHWWTRRVPERLLEAAREARPGLVLLGGDLVDSARALPQLRELVRALAEQAPTCAVPGNHDARAGIAEVREAVTGGGGHWLPDGPLTGPVRVDATVQPGPDGPRVLCAHHPDVFPAAAEAGYALVLAGHLHGGQCVLAMRGERLYPAVWASRWHVLRQRDRGALLLVSRGAADTFPFRFNCPREVLVCELC
jgi:hypothetical protein